MDESELWTPSVNDIMQMFRESLVALVPIMEKARLPWRQEEAYDEWDQIATSLFDGVVLSSIRWGLSAGTFVELALPAYDMVYAHYEELNFIECQSDSEASSGHYSVFHSYVTDEAPFDTVQCYEVDDRDHKLTDRPLVRPIARARFAFWHRQSSGKLKRHERLAIQIGR